MLWTYINVRDLLESCLDNIEILDGHVDILGKCDGHIGNLL